MGTPWHRLRIFVATLAAALAMLPSPEVCAAVTIACYGDSITHSFPYGVGDPLEDLASTYPYKLQQHLNNQYGSGVFAVVNHGVNGQTADGLADDLATEGWLGENPDAALIMVGGNDLGTVQTVQEYLVVAPQTVAEVQQCVDLVKGHTNPNGRTPQVLVAAIPPNLISLLANQAVVYYNALLTNDLTGVDSFFTDNFNDLYDNGTLMADASLMFDPIHPNAAGLTLIAENDFLAIEALSTPLPAPGDANLDWSVNVGDLGIVGAHYQQAGTWADGDFDCDGNVDDDDVGILTANYAGLSAQPTSQPVPEPGAALVVAAAAALLRQCR